MTPSLVTQGLSVEQWATLDRINEALTEEYSLRRRMLLTRCNVTVKSFKWSDKAKVFDSEMSVLIVRRCGFFGFIVYVYLGQGRAILRHLSREAKQFEGEGPYFNCKGSDCKERSFTLCDLHVLD